MADNSELQLLLENWVAVPLLKPMCLPHWRHASKILRTHLQRFGLIGLEQGADQVI